MKKQTSAVVFSCLAALVLSAETASAASLAVYTTLASFEAAVGEPLVVQDFSGFPPGTDLSGVELLPGVSATTNMANLEAFSGNLFGFDDTTRSTGTAYYDIALSFPYFSFAFDIDAFEANGTPSTAVGPGVATVSFADATSTIFDVFGNPTGDPIFIGLVADTRITGIRWSEALEGTGGNEETALDNFRVTAVPEPASLLLVGSGIAGLAAHRRRKRLH